MLCAKGSQLKGELQFMAPFSPCKIDYLYILLYYWTQSSPNYWRNLEWSPAIVTFLSYYYIIILLDFLIISKCVPNRSKSISNDIIRFSPFCSNENMRFSYILIISLECNKSRWSLQICYHISKKII